MDMLELVFFSPKEDSEAPVGPKMARERANPFLSLGAADTR